MRCFLILALFTIGHSVRAQQGVVAVGGEATGAGGRLSYSAGQVGYQAVEGTGGTNAAGVQQPYEYLVLAMDAATADPIVQVAPNPTADGVRVTFGTVPPPGAAYRVLDAAGHLVRTAPITAATVHVPLGDLPPAVYLLCITGSDTRTFQLVKQ